MIRTFRGSASCASLLVTLCSLAAPAHAQGSTMAFVALRGTAQGVFHGTTTDPAHKNDIVPISLTVSQPYGAATPVVHVVTGVSVAPQVVHALVTNEVLVNPTVIFVKPSGNGTLQQFYQIAAQRGYVTGATVALDATHTPTIAFDLMLSGGVASTNQTGAVTTEAPPFVSEAIPVAHGIVLTGEFTGRMTGDFSGSPGTPLHGKELLLDSVAISMTTPVLNGATGGKSMVHQLIIERPTSEDAALFDNARSREETFSKIIVHVYLPQQAGQLADVFDLATQGACFDLGVGTGCAGSSMGMAAGKVGGSAGLAPSGPGAQSSRTGGAVPGIRRSANDASTTMLFMVPELTLTNRQTQTMVTHSFATNTTN